MSDGLVRMRALRAWLNVQHEGAMDPGQIISVSPMRAKDLERLELAVRIVEPTPRVIVHEDPAWGLAVRPVPVVEKARRKR
jgi:hypothetical protein